MKKIFLLLLATSLFSCSENHFKEDKIFAGGVVAKKEQLNLGKTIYTEYCMACHGVNGDGNGVAAKGLVPPPRNFKLGVFKFGKVLSGELPHDDTLVEVIQKGLHGTAMLPWDISKDQTLAVVQYIKTFAPEAWEGTDKELGKKVKASKDPYGMARKGSAIARGKEVYHGVAQCFTCHRAYVSHDEFAKIALKVNDEKLTKDDMDPEMYKLKLQESDHGYRNIPPDFTWHSVRSVDLGDVKTMYYRLAAGVGGTTMPPWNDTISDEDIWAVSYYVMSLMEMKDSEKRDAFIKEIEAN